MATKLSANRAQALGDTRTLSSFDLGILRRVFDEHKSSVICPTLNGSSKFVYLLRGYFDGRGAEPPLLLPMNVKSLRYNLFDFLANSDFVYSQDFEKMRSEAGRRGFGAEITSFIRAALEEPAKRLKKIVRETETASATLNSNRFLILDWSYTHSAGPVTCVGNPNRSTVDAVATVLNALRDRPEIHLLAVSDYSPLLPISVPDRSHASNVEWPALRDRARLPNKVFLECYDLLQSWAQDKYLPQTEGVRMHLMDGAFRGSVLAGDLLRESVRNADLLLSKGFESGSKDKYGYPEERDLVF